MRDSGLPSRPSVVLTLTVLSLVTPLPRRGLAAQAPDSIPAERVAARQWFRDAKFGMFIHWGVYSLLGQGEWVMQQRELPVGTYEWLAKAAGVKYITITSRHHDGFSMFATHAAPYNIVDWTPFKRDPLKELADECQRQGLKLFFYYSQLDWHHPDYWPRGRTGEHTGRPESGDWGRHLDFMDSQPAALIVPNHHKAPRPGEDVQTFEQDLPGANTAGFNTKEIGLLPLETSLTMNNSWGFNITDNRFKSVHDLVGYLVRAAGSDANLLLNIGPRPDGTIQPEAAERLRDVGRWLATYGGSIYGTRAGPVPPRQWGVTTRRADTVFVHVLSWPDRLLALPSLGAPVVRASMLSTGARVDVTPSGSGVTLTLPAGGEEEPDRVVVLTLAARRPKG